MKNLSFNIDVKWENKGNVPLSEKTYSRDHVIGMPGKSEISVSSSSYVRDREEFYSPDAMFLGALSSCHLLWYLHLCSQAEINVLSYEDSSSGELMPLAREGRVSSVTLKPRIIIEEGHNKSSAEALHQKANTFCFIANSVNFPINCRPTILWPSEASVESTKEKASGE